MLTMDVEMRLRWPQLPAPVRRAWSDRPVLVQDRGVPWVFGPVDRPVVMPGRVIRRLKEIAAFGLPFQRLAIAHELDPDGPAAGLLASGSRLLTAQEARALVGPPRAHPALRWAARLLDRVVGATVTGPAEKILDPIVAWKEE
jgi:hypothetical protein